MKLAHLDFCKLGFLAGAISFNHFNFVSLSVEQGVVRNDILDEFWIEVQRVVRFLGIATKSGQHEICPGSHGGYRLLDAGHVGQHGNAKLGANLANALKRSGLLATLTAIESHHVRSGLDQRSGRLEGGRDEQKAVGQRGLVDANDRYVGYRTDGTNVGGTVSANSRCAAGRCRSGKE